MKNNPFIVGLDIGTTKITTVIGELGPNGTVDIIGEGTVPSEGIKRGAVVNLERTTHAIKQSIAAAERVSGVRVSHAYVSVSGHHVKATTSHGLAAIRRNQQITAADVERAIENARAVPLDPNLEVLHAIPQEYVVDGQEGIKSAVGMHGVRLEVDVHIVSGAVGPLANVRRCVQEAGLTTEGFVLQSLASGLAVLAASERDQTVVVIDMGGGTTDVGVFRMGNLAHSASLPIGGDHVTADLMQILKIPLEEAENVKRKYGAALPELADQELTLEITTAAGVTHAITAFDLARIIKPRISEIYDLIRDEIDKGLGPMEVLVGSGGVILTGGGALMVGAADLARERFRLPVRIGKPRGVSGLTDIVSGPLHATSVGLVLYGATHEHADLSLEQLDNIHQSSTPAQSNQYPPNNQQHYQQPSQQPAPQPVAQPAPLPEAKGKPAPSSKPITVTSPEPQIITKHDAKSETKADKPDTKKEAKAKPSGSLGDRMKSFFKDWM